MTDNNDTGENQPKNPPTKYDSPWKDILETYFKEFMEFFFPAAHDQIDWTKKPEFLDKELAEVVADAVQGAPLCRQIGKITSEKR